MNFLVSDLINPKLQQMAICLSTSHSDLLNAKNLLNEMSVFTGMSKNVKKWLPVL